MAADALPEWADSGDPAVTEALVARQAADDGTDQVAALEALRSSRSRVIVELSFVDS